MVKQAYKWSIKRNPVTSCEVYRKKINIKRLHKLGCVKTGTINRLQFDQGDKETEREREQTNRSMAKETHVSRGD